jgi:PAS domain S-box-containing protein
LQKTIAGLFEHITPVVAVIAVLVGGLVLLGWLFDIDILKSFLPSLAFMKFNAALGFILSGVALWGIQTAGQNRLWLIISQTCSMVVLLLGLLTLAEYLNILPFSIDQLLLKETTNISGDIAGRMPLRAAISFTALGAALLLLSCGKTGWVTVINLLAVVPLLSAGAVFINYSYNFQDLLREKLGYTPLALHGTILFVLLSLGILILRPDYPFRRLIISESAAGSIVRRLLPLATGFTFLTGWLIWEAHKAGYFDESYEWALFTATNIVGLGILILWNAGIIYTVDMQRQRTEEDARSAALYARSLIEASLDPLVTISLDGKITDVNEATMQATGVSRRQMIGSDFSEYFTEPDKARVGYQKAFSIGEVTDYPLTLKHVTGKLIDVLYNASLYRNEKGDVAGLFAAARDITQLKQAETALNKTNRVLRTVSNCNHALVHAANEAELLNSICRLIVETSGYRMVWVGIPEQDAAKTVRPVAQFGYDDVYLTEVKISWAETELGRGPTGTALRTGITQVNQNFQTNPASAPWREKALQYGYKSSIALPLKAAAETLGVLTIYAAEIDAFNEVEVKLLQELAEDMAFGISSQRARVALTQSEEHLEEQVRDRTKQLEAVNKDLESFAYSVSHDLRVPLRAIDGFSQQVLKHYADKLDDEGKRWLTVVRDNTKKMGQLIDDILSFSRTGRLELTLSEVKMEAVARAVSEELKTGSGMRALTVEIKPLPPCRGDAAMLRQVWVNLLGNAFKFTRPKPAAMVEVGGRIEGAENIYYIKDNGVGFDMQYADKLFGVFQRLHGNEEFEGTGIGLAIVKRIITRHGGRVWAEGKVGEGATFYFTVPV